MQNKSPIYDVIKELVGGKSQYEPYSYQNKAHFKNLWEFNSSSGTKTMIVVWDGIPEKTSGSVVDTSKYLTPIDWAVGYSLYINNKRKGSGEYPDLRIHIVDDGSQSVSHSDSLKFVYQYCNKEIVSMPWIRIFSIDAFCRTLEDKTPKSWWKRIFSTKTPKETMPSMKEAFDKKTCDLDSIKGIWAASLTRPSTPGDHHAIANLVGPLLLMEEGGDIHVNALQTLMRSIGFLPEKGENNDALLTKGNPWISWNPHKEGIKQLKLILVDDMFQMGWGKILCRGTGVDYKEPSKDDGKDKLVKISDCNAVENEKFVVKATSSANWILKKLETLTNTDNQFEFSLDGNVAASEILFLDLRLYSGGNFEDEVAFFSELINFAKKFEERQNKNLPWPGFTNDELEGIEVWIKNTDKKQEDSEYIDALTILPRILALTDLSLPIILFSSTGRRGITEKIKPYGNIITVFEKPRFTVDIPVDIANQTKIKFYNAMKKALEILAGRQICREVKELAKEAEDSPAMIPDKAKIPGFKHIEIYIDESGEERSTNFSVGGLIMAYPEYNDVNKLSEELKKAGYYWYSDNKDDRNHLSKRPGVQNESYGTCAKTDWRYDKAREKLLELCNEKKIFISGICVWEEQKKKSPKTGQGTRHVLLKDVQGNERYKRLLNTLLELAIYEYIPVLIDNNEVTLSIFPGTRISRLSNNGMFDDHNHDDYFGYGYGPNETYYILGFNSIHPIVSSILRSRDDLCKNLTLHHARGVTIQYGVPFEEKLKNGKETTRNKPQFILKSGGNREKYYVRSQHYFADQVLEPNGINDVYEEIFNTGFVTKFDNNMYVLLDARKKILDSNTAEGIIRASEYTSTKVKDKMHGHLLRKIGESLKPEHFEGFDFLNICEAVEGETAVGELSLTENIKIDKALEADRTKEGGEVDQVVKGEREDNAVNVANPQASEITVRDGFDFLNVCEAVEGETTIVGELSVTENIKIDKALEADRTKEGDEVDQVVKGGRDDNTVNVVNPQTSGITVRVEQIKKKNGIIKHYVCRETSGEARRILITQQKKKDSGITNAIEEGNIFDVSIYTNNNTLYGSNLRRSEVR